MYTSYHPHLNNDLNTSREGMQRIIAASIGLVLAVVVLFNAGIGFRNSTYRIIVSLIGTGLIFIATIYINSFSRTILNARYLRYGSIFIIYCIYLAFNGVIDQEFQKVFGWLFFVAIMINLLLNKEIGVVFWYFILFINLLNFLALLMVLFLHAIPDLSYIKYVVSEDGFGLIHYDTTINLLGYSFRRYTGLVSQSSLIPAYVILPAIMQYIFFGEKYKTLPIFVALLSLITLSGGYISLLILTAIIYTLNRIFLVNSLVFIVLIFSCTLFVFYNFAQLAVFDIVDNNLIVDNNWTYFISRLGSGLARLEIISEMFQNIDATIFLFGSSINATGLFGNFFITSIYRAGLIGLFFSTWVLFSLSKLLKKCYQINSNRHGFFYFALLVFFAQGFTYYDFGISNYYGLLIIFVLFILQAETTGPVPGKFTYKYSGV